MSAVTFDPADSELSGDVRLPTSKPHMQRAILLSLLANAPSTIVRPAWSSEATSLIAAARALGCTVLDDRQDRLVLVGAGPSLNPGRLERPISVQGSAFNFRTLVAVACRRAGTTTIEANGSMLARPILEHLRFVEDLGGRIDDISDVGHLRVGVTGSGDFGGDTTVDSRHSSQVLTAALLIAPTADRPVRIRTAETDAVGTGYVDLTMAMMRDHGVRIDRAGSMLTVWPGPYQSRMYHVPSDFTALSYVAGAVLTVGGHATVVDYVPSALSSEVEFLDVLRRLGLDIRRDPVTQTLHLERSAPAERHVEIDGSNIPTVVPTLTAIAPFVDATVTVRNAAHVNNHKSRRVEVMVAELGRMGCRIEPTTNEAGQVDGFTATGPQRPAGGVNLHDHGDHRVFMSLATAAIAAQRRTRITDVEHVATGFPGYLDAMAGLGIRWMRDPVGDEREARSYSG